MPPPKARGSKMLALLNYRLKVTLNDGRSLIGQMLAFDKHMNLVLAECEEFRRIKKKATSSDSTAPSTTSELKRTLGLVILRGESVVSISVEGPPPKEGESDSVLPAGPGMGMPAGRGMPLAPPSMAARPMPYARPPPGFGGPPGGFPAGMPPPGFAPPGFMPPPGMMPPGMGRPPFGAPPPGFAPPGFQGR